MFTMLAVMVHNINVIECPSDGRLSFAKTSGQRIINKLHKWVTGSWGAPQWELKQKRWCNVGAAETAGAGGGKETPSLEKTNQNKAHNETTKGGYEKQREDKHHNLPLPEARRGEKSASSVERGDARWQSNLVLWGNEEHTTRTLAEINVIGSDLWYKQPPEVTWEKLQGLVVSLNMRGWGTEDSREIIWNTLARTKTMIAVLVDHRQHTHRQRRRMETEIATGWVGIGKQKNASGHMQQRQTTEWGVSP